MPGRRKPFKPLMRRSRVLGAVAIHLALDAERVRQRLTDEDTRELMKALRLEPGDPRAQAARTYLDECVAAGHWRPAETTTSPGKVKREADELRRAAKLMLECIQRTSDTTRQLIDVRGLVVGDGWRERGSLARKSHPTVFDRWPWLEDVWVLHDAAHAVAEDPLDDANAEWAGARLVGPGAPRDEQEHNLARVAVMAFDRFADKPRGDRTRRRARVVEILVKRVIPDCRTGDFVVLTRRAVTAVGPSRLAAR